MSSVRRSGRGFRPVRRASALGLPVLLIAQLLLQLTPVVRAVDVVNVSLNDGTPLSAYLGFNADPTDPNPQNLTTAGASDWRIWGSSTTSLSGDTRKAAGAGINGLSDIEQEAAIAHRALGPLGLGVGTGPSSTPFSFSWADGAPTASGSSVGAGLQHNAPIGGSVGYGFRLTVAGSTAPQRLKLWVSAHHGTGKLTATMGGTVVMDTGVTGGQNNGGVYTIDFTGDGTVEEFLEVTWVLDSLSVGNDEFGFPSTEANVVIYAAALSGAPSTMVDPPVLYQAAQGGEDEALVSGRLSGTPNTLYELTVKTAGTCVDGALGSGGATLAFGANPSFSVTTEADGNAYFGGYAPNGSALNTYVTAEVSGPGGVSSSPSTCIVAGETNDTWTRARTISLTGGIGSATGHIDDVGRARWFKVAIQPGQRLQLNLTNLPADFDMFAFRDITQAFTDLVTGDDLTRLTAEFAPSAFSPSAFSPSAFSPSAFSPSAFSPSAFSPSAFSPSAFSPSAFSPSAFSPSAFSPSAFSPSAFSPSAFSPSAFSPSAFSPSAFSPSAFSEETYAGAQIRSLITGSGAAGIADENITVDTWNNTGHFYIRVSGKNGASSLDPFTLSVTLAGSACDGVLSSPSDGFIAPAGNFETLILTDPSRMSAIPGNESSAKTALDADLIAFAARSEVKGAIVDVGTRPRIIALQAQADTKVPCMYAKNLVAGAIRDVVTAYRATNPGLKYIVIIGGDDAIPFFRYPDQALLGPEQDFQAPVTTGSASDASLRSNFVLGQDAYGSSIDLALHASAFPIPDLPVGRLVETAAEASVMIDAYMATTGGTIAAPTSALVSGYDFLDDAAQAVSADLAAGMGTGGTVNDLISDFDVAPQTLCTPTPPAVLLPRCSWDANALRTALLGGRHDIAFLAGHFSANSTLAADFSTTMLATELNASNVNLTNSIVFSAGCHSGYNVVDPDALTGGSVDWAQAFARKGATLIAGTGYQYGDTDFLEYSERIYAEFARQLRVGTGAVSVGDALARAKQIYLATTPDIRGLHEKALLQATLFGLPMLSVDMPGARLPNPPSGSIEGATTGFATNPGLTLGLRSANVPIVPSLTQHTVPMDIVGGGSATATYYSGSDGVVTNPYEPALPLESRDVTVTGKVLRGVGFRGGTYYTDQTVIPLTGAPADPLQQIRGVHAGWGSPVFYPMRLWTPNYFDALTGGPTRLLVTPAQHRTTGAPDGSATLRLYSALDLRLFYSDYIGAAGLSGAPTVASVDAEVSGGNVTFRARAFGDPQAGMQQVWVTYTGHANAWTSLDLVQDPTDSTLWTKTIPLPASLSGRSIQYMVQAVNGVGLATLDDNLGRLYTFGKGPQTLFFAALADRTYPGANFAVSATATSGLAVAFSAIGQCTVTGSTVTLTGGGSCTITASQAGDDNYFEAIPIAHTFLIRLNQIITFTPAPTVKNLGDADFAIVATSNSGLPVTQTASGVCTISGTTVHLTAIGTCSITANQAGNASYNPVTATHDIDVNWPFTGFFSPVDNLPVFNVSKAGGTIPIKFKLGGDRGLAIFEANYPKAVKIGCDSGTPTDAIEETNSSNSGLTYDPVTTQYQYNWKTPKNYAGSCYRFDLKLIDGSTWSANFQLK